MPNEVQNIIIEFTADPAGLEPAIDQLERLGAIDKQAAAAFKATNAELAKRTQQINTVGKATQSSANSAKRNIDDLDKSVLKLSQDFVQGFQEGVIETLKDAGVSAEQFSEALKTGSTEVSKGATTVRARLKEITQELALMKAAGEDATDPERYKVLTKEAGNLKDAMGDVAQEIKNAGSDTATFDGLINVAQGVTGAFAIAQGSVALFGSENEELQETLLRVNAAMAILQGLQSVQTVLQKESAAARLVDVIATKAQIAAQTLFTFVVGASTGALKLFRIALATTGVGLLVIGLIELVSALNSTSRSINDVNNQLERNKNLIEADTKAIQDLTEIELARAKDIGAAESDLTRIRGRSLVQQRQAILEINKNLAAQRDIYGQTTEEFGKLNTAIEENNSLLKEIDSKIIQEGIQLQTQLRQQQLKAIEDVAAARLASTKKNSKAELEAARTLERAKAAVALDAAGTNQQERFRIEAELQDRLRDLDRVFAQVRQQDRIAALEAALIQEEQASQRINARTSQAEIDLQKRLIAEKARLDLLQEGLTANQKLQIQQKALADHLKLQRDFNKQGITEALQDLVSRNNSELAQVELTSRERLNLQIDNLIAQAAIEIEAANGVAAKIKEIEKNRDAAIKAARLESIRQTVEEEIALRQAVDGDATRQIERQLQGQDRLRSASSRQERNRIEELTGVRRLSIAEQLKLVEQLGQKEQEDINARLVALNKSFQQGLISRKDYNLQYEQLSDQLEQSLENSEQRKTDIILAEEAKRREATKQTILITIDAAQQGVGLLDELFQQQSDKEQFRLDEQRRRVEELRETGAITEQEAVNRMKKLDAEERKIKIQQAQRDKQIAIFQAVIATARAVAQALPNLVLAGIAAAFGGAQIALIASRPLPKFGKGKKNRYQGWAEVGETGSELIERNGRIEVAPRRTITWLAATDKVYNPSETRRILEARGQKAESIKKYGKESVSTRLDLNYAKLGKEIAKNQPAVSLSIDGFKDFVIQGQNFSTYLNNRRSYGV